jgi:hypothetical protein
MSRSSFWIKPEHNNVTRDFQIIYAVVENVDFA